MNREDIKQTMLLAMSEHHSGNAAEAQRIVDAILSALEAAGVRLVNFTALAEDDAAVERVARAIDWALHDDADEYRVARAAIRAMGGE